MNNSIKLSLLKIKPWSKIDEVKFKKSYHINIPLSTEIKEECNIKEDSLSLLYIVNDFIAYSPKTSSVYDISKKDLMKIIKDTHRVIKLPYNINNHERLHIANNLIENDIEFIPLDHEIFIKSTEDVSFTDTHIPIISEKIIV